MDGWLGIGVLGVGVLGCGGGGICCCCVGLWIPSILFVFVEIVGRSVEVLGVTGNLEFASGSFAVGTPI